VFNSVPEADRAIDALIAAGFAKEHISVICPECVAPPHAGVQEEERSGSHTPRAAATGGAIGAVLGGLTAAIGIAASGGTALFVAGPLLYGLYGAAAGAVGGGFVGAMLTRGAEPEIADFYDQALEKGQVLVAVEDDDEARLARAEKVLSDIGAHPIGLTRG
jgi:hypothetical protein